MLKRSRVLGLLLLIFGVEFVARGELTHIPPSLLSLESASQDSAQEVQSDNDSAARNVVLRSLAGLKRNQAEVIKDAELQGDLASPNDPTHVTGHFALYARGSDFLLVLEQASHVTKYRVVGDAGAYSQDGKVSALPWHSSAGMTSGLFPLLDRWSTLDKTQSSVRKRADKQEQNVATDESYEVSITPPSRSQQPNPHDVMRVAIDPANRDPKELSFSSAESTSPLFTVRIRYTYEAYEAFGTVRTPTKIIRYVSGKPQIVFFVRSVKVNSGLSENSLSLSGGTR